MDVVDLCDDDDDGVIDLCKVGPEPPASTPRTPLGGTMQPIRAPGVSRQGGLASTLGSARDGAAPPACAQGGAWQGNGEAPNPVREVVLPDGVVDARIGELAQAIVQQLNCIGVNGRGLAKAVATAFPYADAYATRQPSGTWGVAAAASFSRPGSIDVCRPAGRFAGPVVLNMYSQWEMGAPLKYNRVPAPGSLPDSLEQRERWFQECLDAVSRVDPLPTSIAFPMHIGCGLGGGRWQNYERMIHAFAANHPHVSVLIVKQGNAPSRHGGRGSHGGRGGDLSAARGDGNAAGKRARAAEDAGKPTRTLPDFFGKR